MPVVLAIWEAEAEIQHQPGLHSKLQDSQGYKEKTHLKRKKNPTWVT